MRHGALMVTSLATYHMVVGSTPCNDPGLVVCTHVSATGTSWEVTGSPPMHWLHCLGPWGLHDAGSRAYGKETKASLSSTIRLVLILNNKQENNKSLKVMYIITIKLQ